MRVRTKKDVLSKLSNIPFVFFKDTLKNLTYSVRNKAYAEIGSGKGDFILFLAKNNLDDTFFAIEKNSTIIWKSVNKYMDFLQKNNVDNTNNLFFLNLDADLITNIFPASNFDGIFLNFPDPWPKKRHKKRRLVSNLFLEKYYVILKRDGFLRLHTDQKSLYDELLTNISLSKKWKCVEKNENFYLNNSTDNSKYSLTEYEKKFISRDLPIYHILLRKEIQ